MAFVEWKESYSVGMPDIDQQHRILIEIINRLHDAMRTGSAHANIVRVVDELLEYTSVHFNYEERMIAAAGYPGTAEHARKHRAMVAQVEAFADRVRTARASTPLRLMEFLNGWLTQHILSTDMAYSESLLSMSDQNRS